MIHPENQNQHRVSKIYLKQFGYEIDKEWWVSVYRLGHTSTENLQINTFTAEFNIFDAPYGDLDFRRNFEIQCSKVESHYPVIISNLINQKQLTEKNIEVLCHFIASLLSRSIPFTKFIEMILRNKAAKKRFIDEITMFSEGKLVIEEVLNIVPIELQLNTILGSITSHLVEVLRYFCFIVIEKPSETSWMTTDNPVVLDKKGNFEWLLSPDTEIYLPLSSSYCLFGFNDGATDKTNSLRLLRKNKINKITIENFEKIQKQIGCNLSKYLIMPIYLEDSPINLTLGLI